MEYVLDRENMAVGEIVFDGCQEQPVDMDISLPDYCPDIQRVLKCQIYPNVLSKNISGDRLQLEGSYTVKVFYLDPESKSVRSCEGNDSFSAEITLKQESDGAQVFAFARVEYVNCRATSPRRLDVHGAFSVCARVVVQGQNEVVTNIEGDDVEQQKENMTVSSLAGLVQQQFNIEEVLELGQSKPPADSILRTDAFVILQDVSSAAGKMMLNGEVYIHFLYISADETASAETMEYSLPFSQMLDGAGVTDDSLCNVKIAVISTEAQIRNDYSGDKTYFDVQVRLNATAQIYRKSQMTVVTDAFSRMYELNIVSRQKNSDNLMELAAETYVDKTMLSPDNIAIQKISDVWSEMASASAQIKDGQIVFSGKYSLCVLAVNTENTPVYFERMVDYEYSQAAASSGDDLKCVAHAVTCGISYRMSGGNVEVKTELRLTAEIYSRVSYRAVAEVTADEAKPVSLDSKAALCLYFAAAGEKIWDIAREYRTSVQAIQQENDLQGESVENRGMLLIPI